MIVSRKWLADYVQLDMPLDELVDRLTMSGLNHEGTTENFGDQAIDLEVTSNRPDCLGHAGVAREIAALYQLPLQIPAADVSESGNPIADRFRVTIECPQLCYRFTARIIQGIQVGPSPAWLQDRLQAIGVTPVNNIVDISNYVMFECGQPLHIFDLDHLHGGQIIVREPRPNESLLAIDHREYDLLPGMCVIADADRAVGLGGVMGGADTEVSNQTVNLLIEAAHFNPLAIRNTARALKLFSAASHRFERGVDSHQIGWASRRCCQLIQELAGGELAPGWIDAGQQPAAPQPIPLRYQQIDRILGIPVPRQQVGPILKRLGFDLTKQLDDGLQVTPPTWRGDVTREIDLIEEVGRIYGYEHVPDDAIVPMAASRKLDTDRILDKIRKVLTACGLDEAMTPSLVPESWSLAFSPWTDQPPLESSQGMLGVLESGSQNAGPVKYLRRSLLPSLLEARRINEYKSNLDVELFEIAKVYLPQPDGLPREPLKIGITSEQDFFHIKGMIESIAQYLNPQIQLEIQPCDFDVFDLNQSGQLKIGEQTLGWVAKISEAGKRSFGIRQQVTVAEIDFAVLFDHAILNVTHQEVSPYPAVTRDFNFIVDDQVRWADLQQSVAAAAHENHHDVTLESIVYRETFHDPERDGTNKKRLLMSILFRSGQGTLTGEQTDAVCQSIIARCQTHHNAQLVS